MPRRIGSRSKRLLRELRKLKQRLLETDGNFWQIPGMEWIGSGCERDAYCYGSFVVKPSNHLRRADSHDEAQMMREAKKLDARLRFAPTIRVKGLDIQLKYKPLGKRATVKHMSSPLHLKSYLDLGAHNLGVDRRGRLVAFDF